MESTTGLEDRTTTKLLLIGLGLLAIFDFLFWDANGFGLTFAIFEVALLMVLYGRHRVRFQEKKFQISGALIAALIISTLIEPKPLSVIMTFVCLHILGAALRSELPIGVSSLFSLLEECLRRGYGQFFRDWGQIRVTLKLKKLDRIKQVKGIGASIVFALLALAFLGLFSSANPILGKWLAGFWNEIGFWIRSFFEELSFRRFFFWFFSFAAIWSFLRFQSFGIWKSDIPTRLAELEQKVPVQTVVFFLGIFNFIFLVQNVLDLVFLWCGLSLPENMTHAEYAHRGAYPLVCTALLAILFVLVIFRDQSSSEKDLWAKRLVYIWLAQNLFLLGSAIWRLLIYIDAFSLTLLRAASIVWLLTVAATFVLVIWRLSEKKTTDWLMTSFVSLTFIVLFFCCFINFNGIISDYNVHHCRELTHRNDSPPLDRSYLIELGSESLPALEWLKAQNIDEGFRNQVNETAQSLRDRLKHKLDSDWRAWTIRKLML